MDMANVGQALKDAIAIARDGVDVVANVLRVGRDIPGLIPENLINRIGGGGEIDTHEAGVSFADTLSMDSYTFLLRAGWKFSLPADYSVVDMAILKSNVWDWTYAMCPPNSRHLTEEARSGLREQYCDPENKKLVKKGVNTSVLRFLWSPLCIDYNVNSAEFDAVYIVGTVLTDKKFFDINKYSKVVFSPRIALMVSKNVVTPVRDYANVASIFGGLMNLIDKDSRDSGRTAPGFCYDNEPQTLEERALSIETQALLGIR